MAMYRELGRNHIQLLTDILADLDEILTALTTSTALRFMEMFNTGQMIWERLASCLFPWLPHRDRNFLL
jgi:hypothetical protein